STMALINCPDCGTAVSSHAPACPECGRPFTPQTVRDVSQAAYGEQPYPPRAEPWAQAPAWAPPAVGLHAMSEAKLLVMTLGTVGLYQFYWFYRNWRLRNQQRGARVWPIARAIFSPIFSYFLFEQVEQEAEALDIRIGWSPLVLALGYFIMNLLFRLPPPWLLLGLGTVLPLLQAQRTINEANARSATPAPVNAGYSVLDIAGIVLGLVTYVLILIAPPV
ncbi:MAG TPA: hypothetical protein VFQ39_20595, partial [Longimicrobium sp.]|nr:hypothetical protein [Longimicrobium sp.]